MSGELHIGDVLGGKYRIDELIGQGGMGVVARATQLDLGRTVAVKSLRPEVRGHAEVVERFYREARAASRIGGAHAVQILDVGRTEGGDPFMVMELLLGEDLDRVIRRDGRQALTVAVSLMVQACSGVADAHRVRIIHRDLKPSNLFLATQNTGARVLKVLDFGISRLDDQASQLTRTTTQLGTPHYMSPEQIERPKSVDHRTDIWAMGCIFHKLLVGETPFRGQGMQLISAVIRNTRKKPSEIVPELGPEVDAVVDKCLEPNADKRFQSAEELSEALKTLVPAESTDRPHILNIPSARGQRPSDRPPSSIRTDAGVSVSSLMATTPMPQSDPEAHTAIQVDFEQTMALANTPSPALMKTQLMPPKAPPPRPDVETPAPPSNPRISSPSVEPYGGITPVRNSQFTGVSAAPTPPLSQPAVRPNKRASRMPVFAGLGLVVAIVLGAFVAAPRVAASRARSAAARAGVTFTYGSPKPSFSGWDLSDVSATFDGVPDASLKAKHARYSLAMDELTLDDVELSIGKSPAMVGRIAELLQKDDLRRIEARNVHFTGGNGTVKVECRGARLLVTAVDVPRTDTSASPDRLAYELESTDVTVTAFGLAVSNISGRIEGSRSHGTLTGAAPPGTQAGATLQGSYDRAGVYLSARVPRQKVAPATLRLVTFDRKPDSEHEVEMAIDLRSEGEELKGEVDFTLFGLATTSTAHIDLSSHLSVRGRPDALVVEHGKMRLGPFPMVPTAKLETQPAFHLVITGDDVPVACADLRRAKAAKISTPSNANGVNVQDLSPYVGELAGAGDLDVQVGVDATFADGTPRLAIKLPVGATCGLPIFNP